MRYIYQQLVIPVSINSQQDAAATKGLNDLGAGGWELVCCHPVARLASDNEYVQRFLMIFKRAVSG
jgi:hypothetical protein